MRIRHAVPPDGAGSADISVVRVESRLTVFSIVQSARSSHPGAGEGCMAETTWQIDPAHSTIEFAVKHMMFTTVRGRFKDVKGTIHADEANPSASSVTVEIAAASLDTGVADRDTHLRSVDFLDVEKHPALTFRSKRVEGAAKKEGDRF